MISQQCSQEPRSIRRLCRLAGIVTGVVFGALVLLGATSPALSAAGYPPPRGAVTGVVTDAAGSPLPGVVVSIPQLNARAVTDDAGAFAFEAVPVGTFTLVFEGLGYAAHTCRVAVDEGGAVSLTVVLQLRFIELQPVTVTGTPAVADPFTTASDLGILAGREKVRQETPSLGASLDRLPGVTTIATGEGVGKPVIRGLSGTRIRVLADGISLDYQQYGIRHGANVDPMVAGRLEVVRGASSMLYGSGALGGVVNVIPNRLPVAGAGKLLVEGRLISRYSSNNSGVLGGARLQGAVGGLGWSGTLIRRSAGNMHVPEVPTAFETGVGTDPKFSGELDFTDYEQLTGSFGIGYQGRSGTVGATYSLWRNEHNFLLPTGAGIGQNLENDIVQVNGVIVPAANWLVRPKLSYVRNLRQSNRDGSPRNNLPGDVAIDIQIQGFVGRLEAEHALGNALRGQFGVEYVHQDQDSRGVVPLNPSATVGNFAAFAFEELTFGDLTLTAGARLDMRKQEAEPNIALRLPDTDAGESDSVLQQSYQAASGALGAAYRMTDNLVFAANLGRGFRAPSIFELHVYGEHGGIAAFQNGDPGLAEETSLSTELSIRWRSQRVQAKITGYRNAIDNYIYLANTGELYDKPDGSQIPIMQSEQADVELWGADATVEAQIAHWLQLGGNFETVMGQFVGTDDELPLLPGMKAAGWAKLTAASFGSLRNTYMSLQVRYSGAKQAAGRYEPFWQFDGNPNFGVASTEAYALVDFGLGFDLPFAQRHATLDVTVKNLLNEDYRDFLDTYKGYALSPGRDIIVRLDLPFVLK